MKMENIHFTLWQNQRETELMVKDGDQRISLSNEQFYQLLAFLGPLVEQVFPPPAPTYQQGLGRSKPQQ